MPKMKTHKGTKKRFRLTATGKVKHRAAGTSHLATRMSQKRKRNLRGTVVRRQGRSREDSHRPRQAQLLNSTSGTGKRTLPAVGKGLASA